MWVINVPPGLQMHIARSRRQVSVETVRHRDVYGQRGQIRNASNAEARLAQAAARGVSFALDLRMRDKRNRRLLRETLAFRNRLLHS